MDLKRMGHLIALADTRSFVRAAQVCHLSQSAFSRSIQGAEEELNLQLFNRSTVEITCTDAGTFVVERARKLVFESRCLERDVSFYREKKLGDLAFGVGPYPAATVVPQLLAHLRSDFPGVKVRVEVNNAHYLAEHTRSEGLDFFVADIRNVQSSQDLQLTRFGKIAAHFYVRGGHPLALQPTVQPPQILVYGIASVRTPEVVLAQLGPLMGLESGAALPLALECDDLNLLKFVAMASDTVLASTDAATHAEVADGRLVRLQLQGMPQMFNDMGIFSLRGRSFSLMAEHACNFLEQWAQANSGFP
jgi:DNA-binding transcriptional LysR family regulator